MFIRLHIQSEDAIILKFFLNDYNLTFYTITNGNGISDENS